MNVVWTEQAETSFNAITDYLIASWTTEIAANFVDLVEHTIALILEHSEMFKISSYDNQSREAIITKHTTMFYRVVNDTIEIEYFWGNYNNPKKISETLGVEESEAAYLLSGKNRTMILDSIYQLEEGK